MEIVCDPFEKKINYYWYDTNKEMYIEVDQKESKLAKSEYVKTTIRRRAHEIINIINNDYNVGNIGLEISFVGTDDDFKELCSAIELYGGDANITCIKSERYYNTAAEVMPKIKKEFSEISEILERYSEEQGKKLLEKYNDTIRPSIALCVMGLYSAGKSAFINSIIGREVLPSSGQPTTGKIYEIHCDKIYQIGFRYKNREYKLAFEGDKYNPNGNFESEIIEKLQGIVKSNDTHDELWHMHEALKILNKDKEISDIIEIRLPFKTIDLLTDEFEFVIYDTPGSNSEQNPQHFNILKSAIEEQTNALPIFVTRYETMSAEDNKKILKQIDETENSLDGINTIVVVNRADENAMEELEALKKGDYISTITKWKSTHIFFVSSVLGIASKKENPDDKEKWITLGMYKSYKNSKEDVLSGEMKLYKYNVVDNRDVVNIELLPSEDKNIKLYRNSGLEAVEHEINEYAERYALYYKCQQAFEYLKRAIDLCEKELKYKEQEQEKKLSTLKNSLADTSRKLIDELEIKGEELTRESNTGFANLMKELLLKSSPEKDDLYEVLKKEWRGIKEHKKTAKVVGYTDEKGFEQIQEYVNAIYNLAIEKIVENINKESYSYWIQKMDDSKREYCKVISGSEELSEEQKRILEGAILSRENMYMTTMKFDLRKNGIIRSKKFLIWKRKKEKFDIKKCRDLFLEKCESIT